MTLNKELLQYELHHRDIVWRPSMTLLPLGNVGCIILPMPSTETLEQLLLHWHCLDGCRVWHLERH